MSWKSLSFSSPCCVRLCLSASCHVPPWSLLLTKIKLDGHGLGHFNALYSLTVYSRYWPTTLEDMKRQRKTEFVRAVSYMFSSTCDQYVHRNSTIQVCHTIYLINSLWMVSLLLISSQFFSLVNLLLESFTSFKIETRSGLNLLALKTKDVTLNIQSLLSRNATPDCLTSRSSYSRLQVGSFHK